MDCKINFKMCNHFSLGIYVRKLQGKKPVNNNFGKKSPNFLRSGQNVTGNKVPSFRFLEHFSLKIKSQNGRTLFPDTFLVVTVGKLT